MQTTYYQEDTRVVVRIWRQTSALFDTGIPDSDRASVWFISKRKRNRGSPKPSHTLDLEQVIWRQGMCHCCRDFQIAGTRQTESPEKKMSQWKLLCLALILIVDGFEATSMGVSRLSSWKCCKTSISSWQIRGDVNLSSILFLNLGHHRIQKLQLRN